MKNSEQKLRNNVLIRSGDDQNSIKQIIDWLRTEADRWQTKEGPHRQPTSKPCSCCMQCGEATTYRIIADAIENGEYKRST